MTMTRNTYADRAAHFHAQSAIAATAGDIETAARLEEMAQRAEQAHNDRAWLRADDLRYDNDDCCNECHQHLSDPHEAACLYADLSYATT
ncbi:MAG: hypothetical protein C0482_21905 [Gordonia sp.]|nr:hypothetical protein [Gordonia sp. (in: high G+C Gram-positive bacteria)]